MTPLTIVYVGNWMHSWCTEVHVARDAERIEGVHVVRFQEPPHHPKDPGDPKTVLDIEEVAHMGAEIDDRRVLVLYQRTWGLHRSAIEMFRRLEADGIQTASYHLDLYVGLRRGASIADDPFWRTGTVFSADGDPRSAEIFDHLGINHRWLSPACVSDECYLEADLDPNTEPLVFVGSEPRRYHPEWIWRRQLISAVQRRYGSLFGLYPKGNNPERLHGHDLNRLYASTKIVIGDSLCPTGHVNYWSDRCFETVGRGGFLLFPAIGGLDRYLVDGEHFRTYAIGDLTEVFHLIDYYLDHQDEARSIAGKGQAHIRENHTYVHRVTEMLDVLGLRP